MNLKLMLEISNNFGKKKTLEIETGIREEQLNELTNKDLLLTSMFQSLSDELKISYLIAMKEFTNATFV